MHGGIPVVITKYPNTSVHVSLGHPTSYCAQGESDGEQGLRGRRTASDPQACYIYIYISTIIHFRAGLFKCRYMPYTMDIPQGTIQHEVGFGFELGKRMAKFISAIDNQLLCMVVSCVCAL